jgi:hypothetical protein
VPQLIFAHASLAGVLIDVAFLGLSVLLLLSPVRRTAIHSLFDSPARFLGVSPAMGMSPRG